MDATQLLFRFILEVLNIGCFKCTSIGGSNPACDDTFTYFENTTGTQHSSNFSSHKYLISTIVNISIRGISTISNPVFVV